jgi:hypothetical protein
MQCLTASARTPASDAIGSGMPWQCHVGNVTHRLGKFVMNAAVSCLLIAEDPQRYPLVATKMFRTAPAALHSSLPTSG